MSSNNDCIKVDDSLSVKCITLKSDSSEPCIQVEVDVPYIDVIPDTKPDDEPTDPSERPELSLLTINGESPIPNVNYDEEGVIYYIKDHDVIILNIDNYDPEAIYLDMEANTDIMYGELYDNQDGTLIWAVGDNIDGIEREFKIRCQEPDMALSEYGYSYVTTMERSNQPILSGDRMVSRNDTTVVVIDTFNPSNTYSEVETTGGSGERTEGEIVWDFEDAPSEVYYSMKISTIEPLKYESSKGEVIIFLLADILYTLFSPDNATADGSDPNLLYFNWDLQPTYGVMRSVNLLPEYGNKYVYWFYHFPELILGTGLACGESGYPGGGVRMYDSGDVPCSAHLVHLASQYPPNSIDGVGQSDWFVIHPNGTITQEGGIPTYPYS